MACQTCAGRDPYCPDCGGYEYSGPKHQAPQPPATVTGPKPDTGRAMFALAVLLLTLVLGAPLFGAIARAVAWAFMFGWGWLG